MLSDAGLPTSSCARSLTRLRISDNPCSSPPPGALLLARTNTALSQADKLLVPPALLLSLPTHRATESLWAWPSVVWCCQPPAVLPH